MLGSQLWGLLKTALLRVLPRSLAADRRAVTAIEYAIIAGALAAVIVATVSHIGPELTPTFNTVSSEL